MARPDPTWVYHFTRVEHLASIIEHGLVCDTRAHRPGLLTTEIGDLGIKEGRAHRQVPVGMGGVVADYVPFYYAPRSPMMYSISRGRVPTYQQGCDRLVYLVTSTQRLRELGLHVVGTDRHPLKRIARFATDDSDVTAMTDWALMRERHWSNTPEDPERRERRQAECLVHHGVPREGIVAVAARSEAILTEATRVLTTMGASWVRTSVRGGWYF